MFLQDLLFPGTIPMLNLFPVQVLLFRFFLFIYFSYFYLFLRVRSEGQHMIWCCHELFVACLSTYARETSHQSSTLSSHLLPHCHESAPLLFRMERYFNKFLRLIMILIPLIKMRIEIVSTATGIIHSYSALK
jgi:hypothetical protein